MKTIFDLGRILDNAERAANAFYDGGGSESQFDFENERGHLQHNAAKCPLCRKSDARADYFSAVRAPVVAAREKLQSTPTPGDLWPEVLRLHDVRHAAQAHYRTLLYLGPDLSTARERCDAAASEERAESDYEIISDRWLKQYRAHEALLAAQAHDRRARLTGKVKRYEVVDGYIRTGKTMVIDGERIPVVRKVERNR